MGLKICSDFSTPCMVCISLHGINIALYPFSALYPLYAGFFTYAQLKDIKQLSKD